MREVLEVFIDHADGEEVDRKDVIDELLNNLDMMEFSVGEDSWYVVTSAHVIESN